jgi:hypothetical protein
MLRRRDLFAGGAMRLCMHQTTSAGSDFRVSMERYALHVRRKAEPVMREAGVL